MSAAVQLLLAGQSVCAVWENAADVLNGASIDNASFTLVNADFLNFEGNPVCGPRIAALLGCSDSDWPQYVCLLEPWASFPSGFCIAEVLAATTLAQGGTVQSAEQTFGDNLSQQDVHVATDVTTTRSGRRVRPARNVGSTHAAVSANQNAHDGRTKPAFHLRKLYAALDADGLCHCGYQWDVECASRIRGVPQSIEDWRIKFLCGSEEFRSLRAALTHAKHSSQGMPQQGLPAPPDATPHQQLLVPLMAPVSNPKQQQQKKKAPKQQQQQQQLEVPDQSLLQMLAQQWTLLEPQQLLQLNALVQRQQQHAARQLSPQQDSSKVSGALQQPEEQSSITPTEPSPHVDCDQTSLLQPMPLGYQDAAASTHQISTPSNEAVTITIDTLFQTRTTMLAKAIAALCSVPTSDVLHVQQQQQMDQAPGRVQDTTMPVVHQPLVSLTGTPATVVTSTANMVCNVADGGNDGQHRRQNHTSAIDHYRNRLGKATAASPDLIIPSRTILAPILDLSNPPRTIRCEAMPGSPHLPAIPDVGTSMSPARPSASMAGALVAVPAATTTTNVKPIVLGDSIAPVLHLDATPSIRDVASSAPAGPLAQSDPPVAAAIPPEPLLTALPAIQQTTVHMTLAQRCQVLRALFKLLLELGRRAAVPQLLHLFGCEKQQLDAFLRMYTSLGEAVAAQDVHAVATMLADTFGLAL